MLLALALLLAMLPVAPAQPTEAAGSVAMPFAGGSAVKIIQGYNGGTHQGRSQYGLDLVLAGGGTSGAQVVSPIEGKVTWSQASSHGCIAIALKDDSYSVMMCHIALRAFSRGDAIARGETIGTVGAPGTYGNNGVSHVHLELHKGGQANNPVPFAEPNGLALEGIALPASSTTAVIAKRDPIVSSNGRGSSTGSTLAKSEGTSTVKLSSTSKPVELAAASLPEASRSIPTGASGASASTAVRKAIVTGTDSCLNVRKQPSSGAAIVGCVKEGSEIALKPLASGADPKWRQTDQGWVSNEFLKRSQAVVTGTNACLNVRESAKATAAKLGCLSDGTGVTIAEGPTTVDGAAWYRIEAAGSATKGGWVIGQYLD
jgi:hypothetical protein